jgi:hypothetical protein
VNQHKNQHKNNAIIVFMIARARVMGLLDAKKNPVELCIDSASKSLDSSTSSYDSMLQSLHDELNVCAGANSSSSSEDLGEFEDVDFGATAAIMLDYDMNCTLKQLKHIAAYYGLKCKNRKADLIQDIVLFECDVANNYTVARRKRLFHYMDVLKSDDYLKSYVIM